MRIGAWRLAATLLALALPSPAVAQADQPERSVLPAAGRLAVEDRLGPPTRDDGAALIAVVDSGLWSGFDDFAGYLDTESADCIEQADQRRAPDGLHPGDVKDINGHGTKVATLAAAPANGKGSVGVSPELEPARWCARP